jgi:alpha-ribazole phosphatase
MIIDLLRHGATHTLPGQLRGRSDDALTPEGWQQMRAASHSGHWHAIASSTLARCSDFAHELAQTRQLPIHLDARLAELDFGHWEGRSISELLQDPASADALRAFWSDPWRSPPPGGESMTDFAARILAALRELSGHHAGQRVLLITHGGVIRFLLAHARRLPPDALASFDVPHASLHRIDTTRLFTDPA